MADKQAIIIKKKVDTITDILNSEAYKEADKLIKRLTKMKEEVKKYCEKNDITTLEGDKGKVEFNFRKQRRVDNNLLDEEVREEATVEIPIWFGYYEKK